jgi:hypothetical protein
VNLAVLDGTEILYLSVFESQHTFRMVSEVGRRRPLYCTPQGESILAHLPPEQQRKIIRATQFERFTPHIVGSAEELNKDLHKIHRRGYALDDEETVAGARCIAVAILNHDRKVSGSISVSGPVVRVTKPQIAEFAARLHTATDDIASRLKILSGKAQRHKTRMPLSHFVELVQPAGKRRISTWLQTIYLEKIRAYALLRARFKIFDEILDNSNRGSKKID